jgi:hypothetical protein
MEELQALLESNRPWAAQRAAMAMHLAESYNRGDVSASECRELLQDLIRTDTLDKEADDMETKALLVAGVYGLLQII